MEWRKHFFLYRVKDFLPEKTFLLHVFWWCLLYLTCFTHKSPLIMIVISYYGHYYGTLWDYLVNNLCSVTSNLCFMSCSSVSECRMLACSFMLLCSVFFLECLSRSTCCSRLLVFLSSSSHLWCDVKQQLSDQENAASFTGEKLFKLLHVSVEASDGCVFVWVGCVRVCVCVRWLVTQRHAASLLIKSKCHGGAEPGLDLQVDSQRWGKALN